jgi:hypothetical protein
VDEWKIPMLVECIYNNAKEMKEGMRGMEDVEREKHRTQ